MAVVRTRSIATTTSVLTWLVILNMWRGIRIRCWWFWPEDRSLKLFPIAKFIDRQVEKPLQLVIHDLLALFDGLFQFFDGLFQFLEMPCASIKGSYQAVDRRSLFFNFMAKVLRRRFFIMLSSLLLYELAKVAYRA